MSVNLYIVLACFVNDLYICSMTFLRLSFVCFLYFLLCFDFFISLISAVLNTHIVSIIDLFELKWTPVVEVEVGGVDEARRERMRTNPTK